jgi:hypothetical protein
MAMEKFRSSPLPIPPQTYDSIYMRQLIQVLELYFGRLDSQTPVQAEYFKGRGDQLVLPHIAASDDTDQYATGDDVPTLVNWSTLDSGSGFTLNSPGSATADYAGVYKIDYSLQFVNTDNASHYATVWIKLNGADVSNSATQFFIPARKSVTDFSYVCAYSTAVTEFAVGDEVEIYWVTNKAYSTTGPVDGVYMFHDDVWTDPPDAYDRPAIPSAIGSITFVSAAV